MCPCCSRSATWTKPSSSGGCLKGKGKVCAPRFKKSGTRPSIRFTRNAFRFEGKTLGLTRVGSIPVTWSRDLPSEPSSATVVKDCAGPYCANFVVEVERPELEPSGKAVGVDLGLASLAVTSDGKKDRPSQVPQLRLPGAAEVEPQGEGLQQPRQGGFPTGQGPCQGGG